MSKYDPYIGEQTNFQKEKKAPIKNQKIDIIEKKIRNIYIL